MSPLTRIGAVVSIGLSQLRHDRARTALAVLGVVLAVLAATLLAGTGIGVVETGQERLDAAGRDLWITGGPVELAPGSVGGLDQPITDAHQLKRELNDRPTVTTASPLLFQAVYVSTSPDPDSFETIVGVGIPSSTGLSVSEGRQFAGDTHYAGGNYTGNRTREVLVDPRTAALLDVGVNDTIYVGGTIASARANPYRVVGVSGTTANFLSGPSMTLPLSELQAVTGTTGTDPATIVTVRLTDNASAPVVEERLQRAYPSYDVRTNREQLESTVQRQAVVVAGGASLVVLSVIAGLALTLNVLLSMLQRQRREFAALKAVGCSSTTLAGVAAVQALVVGVVGAVVGVGLTFPIAWGLDQVALALTGFENVVRTTPAVVAGGAVAALATGLLTSVVGAVWLRLLRPLETLE